MSTDSRTMPSQAERYTEDVRRWKEDRAAADDLLRSEGQAEWDAGISPSQLENAAASAKLPPRVPPTADELARWEERRAAAKAQRAAAKKIREEYAAQDAEAALHRGVRYDWRLKKFVARFYDRPTRRDLWLGAHGTAAEAGAAYQAHFDKAPKKKETNVEAYLRWKNTSKARSDGHTAVGEVFVAPDGQKFELVQVCEGYGDGGKVWWEYHFASSCRTCGATYFFNTPAYATGFTRNCSEHKRKTNRRATGKKLQEAAHEPEDGSDLV